MRLVPFVPSVVSMDMIPYYRMKTTRLYETLLFDKLIFVYTWFASTFKIVCWSKKARCNDAVYYLVPCLLHYLHYFHYLPCYFESSIAASYNSAGSAWHAASPGKKNMAE